MNGYAVEVIQDGNLGLKKAMQGIYDLIVIDLMLPNKSGFMI